jgi:hypothetical protein
MVSVSPRLAQLIYVLLLAAPLSCMRAGFDVEPDGGPDNLDAATDQLAPAALDGDCQSGNGCLDGLVCTGLPGQRTCRPRCAKPEDCAKDEVCARPIDLSGKTLEVDPACLPTTNAMRFESCGLSPACVSGLSCINMPGETFWSFCAERCSADPSCLSGEACEPDLVGSDGLCLRLCSEDADCPGKLRCTGLGGAPQNRDYCLSNNPAGTDAPCNATMGSFCAAQHRCLSAGTGLPSMCVPFCDNLGQCPAGRRCYEKLTSGRDYCMRQCDPAASSCPAGQLCLPHIPTLSAFCVAGEGLPLGAVCSGDPPCADGAFCSGQRCRKVCKDSVDCETGQSCRPTNAGSTDLPWKVCIPNGS